MHTRLAPLLIALIATGCQVRTLEHTFEDPDGALRRLELSGANGTVDVLPGEVLRVERRAEYGTASYDLTADIDGDAAVLGERCALPALCRVDAVVELPPGMALDVALGTGEVWLSDVDGEIVLDLGAASLTGVGLEAPRVQVLAEKVDVELELLATPVEVAVAMEVGDATIDLPAGSYDLDVNSGLGEVTLWNVIHDAGADGVVEVRTGAGDVAITGLGAAAP
ncbi:MAG: hypothetical protein H6739_10630 [Alphaproteobacteria bacterium]|nr:hypothetical protein [Alphaproteobacteria bacterium]